MFLDPIALMLVLVPIYLPLLKLYGFDEIWFWTLFLVITVVGGLTPPFGYTLFAMKSAAPEVPTTAIFQRRVALRLDHRAWDVGHGAISPDHYIPARPDGTTPKEHKMKRRIDAILTTHVGRLQRPDTITEKLVDRYAGKAVDQAALDAELKVSVAGSFGNKPMPG